ncbi:MAG: hypothetical protein R2941_24785 [Desulfobacterales bacterium]
MIRLYRFIDWIMALPSDMENVYHEKLLAYEREVNMQYITTAERIGMEKGIQQGLQQGIQKGVERGILPGSLQTVLEMKFGPRGLDIYPKIKRIQKTDRLEKILQTAKAAASAEEVLMAVQRKKQGLKKS